MRGWDVRGMLGVSWALSLLLEGRVWRLNGHLGTFCSLFFGCKAANGAREIPWFAHSSSSPLCFQSEQLLRVNRKTCNTK